MKPYGYITLKEAADLKYDGRPTETEIERLKKQCQEGRIRGAVKMGGSWFVPRQEIRVNPVQADDSALFLLVALAEAAGIGIGVTVYMNGLILEGRLISTKKYVEYLREHLKINVAGEAENQAAAIQKAMDTWFDTVLLNNKESKADFLHLDNVTAILGSANYEPNGALLRLRLDAIDGYQLGTTKVLPTEEVRR